MNETNVPAIVDDGFDNDQENNRLIRGGIVRCVDGNWTDSDGNPVPSHSRMIAWATTDALQRWNNKVPVETIMKEPGKPLPDVDELNDAIPQKEWEKGIDGKPRPPWGRQVVVY